MKNYPFKNTVSLSTVPVIKKQYLINYERKTGNKTGVLLSVGSGYNEDIANWGYLGELQFKYYFQCNNFKKDTWHRFFISPYVFENFYQNDKYSYSYRYGPCKVAFTDEASIHSFGGGIIFGYCLSINRISFELYGGEGFRINKLKTGGVNSPLYKVNNGSLHEGVNPKWGLNIGFSF